MNARFGEAPTFSRPVLLGVTKEHYQFIKGERLKVSDREHLRETFSECLGLQLGALPDDCLDDFRDIFLNIFRGHTNVLAIWLESEIQPW
jgi:hypothetical protein